MNCCICQQKTSEILYPILPMKNFGGYLKQFGVNNKMAYKTSCIREYVHMRCAVFIRGLKWVKEQFSKTHVMILLEKKNNFKQIDYVCFGFEQVQAMKLKKQECSICLSIFETRTVHHWRKTISVIIDCEHPQCTKSFHVDCLIQRKKRILWDRSQGELHILCQQHCRSQNPALEELNWDAIENTVTHIVHTNLVSRDLEYQKYVSPDPHIEINEESVAEDIQYDGQRNVQKYYQQPSINSEYSKPRPLYEISYQRKQASQQPEQSRTQKKFASLTNNTSANFNLLEQMLSESEHENPEAEDIQNEDEYYQQYYRKPAVDDRIYETRGSEEKATEAAIQLQQNKPPEYIEIAALDLPEDIIDLPKSRSPSLQEQDRFTHQYINRQYETIPRQTNTLQEENPEGRIMSVTPKPKNVYKDIPATTTPFRPIVKKQEEQQRYQAEVEPAPTKKVAREESQPLIRRVEAKSSYTIEQVNCEPVYPEEEEKREEAMRAYWKCIDSCFFPIVLPTESLSVFEEQFNTTAKEDLDDPIPSLQCFELSLLSVIAQGLIASGMEANMYLHYALIRKEQEKVVIECEGGTTRPLLSIANNLGESLVITQSQEPELSDMQLVNVTNITSREFRSCESYQQFLNSRPPSLTSELDQEYQYLMEECGAIQDETRAKKRELLERAASHKATQTTSMGEKYIDELRWLEVAKCLRQGLLKKDEGVLKQFQVQVSLSFKKIIHLYPPDQPTTNTQTDCKVCFFHRSSEGNPLVYCDACDSSYHKWCYGIVEALEEKTHLCDVCTFQKKHNVPINKVNCFLCKQHYEGVPLKQLRGNFFHVTCLFLSNYIVFENRSLLIQRHITWTKIESTVARCEQQKCLICGEHKGKKEKCFRNDCQNHFHLLCAYLYGLEMGLAVEFEQGKIGTTALSIRCHQHDTPSKRLNEQIFYRRFPINYKGAAQFTNAEQYINTLDDKWLPQVTDMVEEAPL